MNRGFTASMGALAVLFALNGAHAWARADAPLRPPAVSQAAKAKKAISRCVKYQQKQAKDGVSAKLSNHCDVDLTCTLRWTLRCQDGQGARSEHAASQSFALADGTVNDTFMSADACGYGSWQVSRVHWNCAEP